MDADKQQADQRGAEEYRARNGAARIAYLVADVADAVIAEVRIHRQPHGGSEPRCEIARPLHTRERYRRTEMQESIHDDPDDDGQHAQPDRHGQFSKNGDAAIEQNDDRDARSKREEARRTEKYREILRF